MNQKDLDHLSDEVYRLIRRATKDDLETLGEWLEALAEDVKATWQDLERSE